MATIKTRKGEEILVDDDKFEFLNQFTWHVSHYGYARTQSSKKKHGYSKAFYMHRCLTNCPDGLVVDHINANKLDNRLENLEIVTQNENARRVNHHRYYITV